ncbi:hypothetical protein JYT71_01390 [Acidimicrobiaceae bacterium AH-315-P05]|nr:hypothetical protein [Acidimicrobiaceae bacterium AH-315-P05]
MVEYVPAEHIRIVSTGGTMEIDVTRTVESLADGRSLVGAVVRGEPPKAMKLLGPLLPRLVGSRVKRDYQNLKSLLEAR